MRVMVLIKANEQYEAGAMPSKELIARFYTKRTPGRCRQAHDQPYGQ